MLRRSVLTTVLLICSAGSGSYGQSSPLRAEIELTRISVKNNEVFSVSTTIRNVSGEEQSLTTLDCGYSYQWTADNPLLRSGAESCLQNALSTIRLGPGGSYKRKVRVSALLRAGSDPKQAVTFRLGFVNDDGPMTQRPGVRAATAPRLWSNAVTVTVTR